MVDRATALEQQAAGSFDELEQQLARAAIAPRPVPLTPEQLEALGIAPPPLVDEHRAHRRRSGRRAACAALRRRGQGRPARRDARRVQGRRRSRAAADAHRAHEPRAPAAVALDARGAQPSARSTTCAARWHGRVHAARRRLRRLDRSATTAPGRRRRAEARRRAGGAGRARWRLGVAGGARRAGRRTTSLRRPERLTVGRGRRAARPARARRADALLRLEPQHDQRALRQEHGRRAQRISSSTKAPTSPGRASAPTGKRSLHLVSRRGVGPAVRARAAGRAATAAA